MNKSLLIIGAGGFIGGFIAKRALELGYQTWVGVRQSTSRRYLDDPRLKFVVLDYENPDQIDKALTEAAPQAGRWDFIIYNLGATKCTNFADFNKINYIYLRNFTDALQRLNMVPERFLYMSSLSALGPVDEKTHRPITDADIPIPNTRYGVSKIKAETHLMTIPRFPYIIFRPTGVYGPHERDYLMMIQSIDRHFDFAVGFKRQDLTFIYVEDLVNAMFDALAAPAQAVIGKKYIISEPRSYTQSEFRRIVSAELRKKFVIPVRLPMWAVFAASFIAEKWGVLTMKASTLNRDKFRIMRQRNWRCDVTPAQRDFNFTARFPLTDGIRQTVRAYRNQK